VSGLQQFDGADARQVRIRRNQFRAGDTCEASPYDRGPEQAQIEAGKTGEPRGRVGRLEGDDLGARALTMADKSAPIALTMADKSAPIIVRYNFDPAPVVRIPDAGAAVEFDKRRGSDTTCGPFAADLRR
jgi:hypothetical protein